jgi:hypothetical protein
MGKRLVGAMILAVILVTAGSGCGLCRRYLDPCYDPCNDPCRPTGPPPVVRSADPCQ